MSPDARLIEDLAAQGLTQRAIAAKVGVAQSTVSAYLNRNKILEPKVRWGLGAAKLVEPATREATELVVFVSDWHVPYHDERMIDAAVALCSDIQPHRIVFNGDMADYFALSRFNKGLERLDSLQEEIDATNAVRRRFRNAAPNADIRECEGNHCSRLRTYVQLNARALTSLRNLQPTVLNAWDDLEITPHADNGFLLRPHYLVKHGNIVRSEVGATAKAELLAAGVSGTSGHVHRMEFYGKAGYSRREWWSSGCLCRLDPDYVPGGVPNWRSGCLVGEFSTTSEEFVIQPVFRFEDSLLYGGRVY